MFSCHNWIQKPSKLIFFTSHDLRGRLGQSKTIFLAKKKEKNCERKKCSFRNFKLSNPEPEVVKLKTCFSNLFIVALVICNVICRKRAGTKFPQSLVVNIYEYILVLIKLAWEPSLAKIFPYIKVIPLNLNISVIPQFKFEATRSDCSIMSYEDVSNHNSLTLDAPLTI